MLFRVTFTNLIEFKGDEALLLLLSTRPMYSNFFAQTGTVSSVAIANPPLINYLLFPFVTFSRNPDTVSFFIGVINSLAIVLFFFTIKKYHKERTAVFSTILLCLSPWAIIYSRKIWNPDFILPLFVILFFSVHKIVKEKRNDYWIVYIVFSLFLVQIHLINLIFIFFLTLLILKDNRPKARNIILGLFVGLLPIIPYIIFEINNNCPDCKSFIESRARLTTNFSPQLLLKPFQITGISGFDFLIGNKFTNLTKINLISKILLLFYPLLISGVFLFYKENKKYRVFVYATFLTPIFYFLLRIENLMHYFIILLPIIYLIVGYLFSFLTTHKIKYVRSLGYSLFFVVIICYTALNIQLFVYLSRNTNIEGDYGSIFSYTKAQNLKILSKYRKDIHFEEMFLFSYVPRFIFQGDYPMAKVFYDREKTKNNLSNLENRLMKIPEDNRIITELISYYSPNIPTIDKIIFLRGRSKFIPGYYQIYNELYYGSYLLRGHKKELRSKNLGISFAYPEHWNVKEDEKYISVYGDDNYLKISTTPVSTKSKKINGQDIYFTYKKGTKVISEIIKSLKEY